MKTIEYSLDTQDSLTLFGRGWLPDQGPSSLVCLVHGLGEHSGRYAHLAEYLTRSGFGVLIIDLRGHGASQGLRGHTPSMEAFMADLDLLVGEAERRYTGLPCFLYGHSLGGLLVLNYVLRRKPHLAGVIVTGPGLRSSLEEQKLKLAAARLLGAFFPTLSMSSGLIQEHLSRDRQVVKLYRDDPLVHDRATLAMSNHCLGSIPWVFSHASEFSLPLLIMQGKEDKLVYPQGSVEFTKLVSTDCTLKLWDGLYHEIHNEPEKEAVLAYLVAWLEEKYRSWGMEDQQ